MHQGAIQQVGPPLELYDRPKNQFVAGFLGSPPMNFLEGVVQKQGDDTQFVSDGWTIRLDRQAAFGVQRYAGCRMVQAKM
jgi:multiple sugar transport system ATP-binding protein